MSHVDRCFSLVRTGVLEAWTWACSFVAIPMAFISQSMLGALFSMLGAFAGLAAIYLKQDRKKTTQDEEIHRLRGKLDEQKIISAAAKAVADERIASLERHVRELERHDSEGEP